MKRRENEQEGVRQIEAGHTNLSDQAFQFIASAAAFLLSLLLLLFNMLCQGSQFSYFASLSNVCSAASV